VTVAVARSSLSSLRAASPQRRAMSLVFVRPSVDCHSTTVPYRCLLVAPMIYLCSSVSSVPSIPGTPSFLCAVLCFSRRSLAASLDCPFRPCGDVLALVPSQCIHRPCCSRGHATACPFIRRPTRFPLPSHLSSVADQTGRLLGLSFPVITPAAYPVAFVRVASSLCVSCVRSIADVSRGRAVMMMMPHLRSLPLFLAFSRSCDDGTRPRQPAFFEFCDF